MKWALCVAAFLLVFIVLLHHPMFIAETYYDQAAENAYKKQIFEIFKLVGNGKPIDIEKLDDTSKLQLVSGFIGAYNTWAKKTGKPAVEGEKVLEVFPVSWLDEYNNKSPLQKKD
jgi:hypothetical protein